MDFILDRQARFIAPIDASNTAHLAGTTIPTPESALMSASSTLPLHESLWHRHFAHHHQAGVRRLLSEGIVLGLKLDSTASPDPICEPCLSGKLNAAPFPTSNSKAARPLALIPSDVHGPLPVRTHSGYRYWITFIDDSTRFHGVLLLKTKGEAFSAFQQLKALAENQTGEQIGALRDDKGGEYMSSEMEQYCIAHGIERQHTVRNRL